eukprot:9480577-Pyramimonas_sp.AAC.2
MFSTVFGTRPEEEGGGGFVSEREEGRPLGVQSVEASKGLMGGQVSTSPNSWVGETIVLAECETGYTSRVPGQPRPRPESTS